MSAQKTPDDYFTDWEAHVFGYGYGTGEAHILPALRRFLELCKRGGGAHGYDYEELERELSPAVAWLLINALCHADIIEYGTSPRGGWLTNKGKRLREFVLSRSADDLYELTMRDESYTVCGPDFCNCGPMGYEQGRVCPNPFWRD